MVSHRHMDRKIDGLTGGRNSKQLKYIEGKINICLQLFQIGQGKHVNDKLAIIQIVSSDLFKSSRGHSVHKERTTITGKPNTNNDITDKFTAKMIPNIEGDPD